MGLGIAEVHQHVVAHVLGNKTVEPTDGLRDAFVISADHGTQVLGIKLGRERRGASRGHRTEAPWGSIPAVRSLRVQALNAYKLGHCRQNEHAK
jgi:hypothetical protein